MNAVIYCRVSSKEQVQGTSLESQELVCREFAEHNQFHIARVFIERGESAKFADRAQLLELLEFCGKPENDIKMLLVWKVDRLARNVGDHFNIKSVLLKQGCRVVSVTEPIDSNPEGKLLETILAGFAQFDNDLRAARTVQGMRRKMQEGLFPWKAPLGYKTTNQPGQKKTQPNPPDQPVFSLLQRAWNEFATGAYTKSEILRAMTAWGIRTARGKPLSKQTLDGILCDPFYAGMIRDPWSRIEYTGRHLPMVSRETFATVQSVIKSRNRSIRHFKVRSEFPLRACARCGGCSYYLTGSFSRGRSQYYPYYHCYKHGCNTRTNVRVQVVHQEFTGFLDSVSLTPHSYERFKSQLADLLQKRFRAEKMLIDRKLAVLERLKEQEEQLIHMRMESLISDQQFADNQSHLMQRRKRLDSEARIQDLDEDHILAMVDKLSDCVTNLSTMWRDQVPADMKARFQQSILPTGFVAGRIGTATVSRLFSTFRQISNIRTIVVPPDGQLWNQLIPELQSFTELLQGMRA